jgi:FkbM family methyltransferase
VCGCALAAEPGKSQSFRMPMPKFTSGLKWIVPHGVASLIARKWRKCEIRRQSERQEALFRQFVPRGSIAFDVGANIGNRIAALLNCGAMVVAVEPQPDCVARLQSTYPSNVTVVQAAVGKAQGKLALHVSGPFDTMASLSDDFISNAQKTQRFGSREWKHSIDVDVITLDSLVSRFGTPSFIKIDVEGFEHEALSGLTHAVEVISFEWTSDAPEKSARCVDLLANLGMAFFQFSFGESMLLAHRTSLDVVKAKQLIALLGEEPTLFGDIYASRRPLARSGS